MKWLDGLLRNRRWFRITTPQVEELSGVVNSQGIDICVKSGWDEIHVQISREHADKLRDWLVTVLPTESKTISLAGVNSDDRLSKVLPIR